MPRRITRVLLVPTPDRGIDEPYGCGSVQAGNAAGADAVAEALRDAGYRPEVCDDPVCDRAVEARIEHSWPEVVVAVGGGRSQAATVLGAAKRAVPDVVTVALGDGCGMEMRGGVVDYELAPEDPQALTDLLDHLGMDDHKGSAARRPQRRPLGSSGGRRGWSRFSPRRTDTAR
jgi:hypothetical protein